MLQISSILLMHLLLLLLSFGNLFIHQGVRSVLATNEGRGGSLDPGLEEGVEYVYEYIYEDSGGSSGAASAESEAEIDAIGRSAKLPTTHTHPHLHQQQQNNNNNNANRVIDSKVEISSTPERNSVPKAEPEPETMRPKRKNGFTPRPGFAIRKNLLKPFMSKLFVNQTSAKYGCAPREIAQTARAIRVLADEPLQLEGLTPLERLKAMSDRIEGVEDEDEEVVKPVEVKQDQFASKIKKRPTFREIQEEKAKKRAELKKAAEAVKPKFILGSDCERLLCGSCRVMVGEFGDALQAVVKDPKIVHVDQVLDKFCESQKITARYDDIVGDICRKINDEQVGYRDVLIDLFDKEKNVDRLNNQKLLYEKEWLFCGETLQVCSAEDFKINFKPKTKFQMHWNSTCFVCQEFTKLAEERIQLFRTVTDSSAGGIIAKTCDILQLEPEYDAICRTILSKHLDDISWLAKTHEESVAKGEKAEIRWPDKICETFKYCTKWVDPDLEEEDGKTEDEEENKYF